MKKPNKLLSLVFFLFWTASFLGSGLDLITGNNIIKTSLNSARKSLVIDEYNKYGYIGNKPLINDHTSGNIPLYINGISTAVSLPFSIYYGLRLRGK